MDLREQIDEAASDWALSYPISSRALAEGAAAAKIASIWGKQIGRAVWAVVGPALAAKDAEIARLRADLAEANHLVGTYMAAAQVADRQRKRAEQAEATNARVEALADDLDELAGPDLDWGVRAKDAAAKIRNALAQPGAQEGTT